VQELIEVPVPQPRSPDQFLSPEFLATKKRLEELIHPPQEAAGINGDHLNMVRMVSVHDEVESVF
jgi:NitT/TauT family transport system ATP-binding protein